MKLKKYIHLIFFILICSNNVDAFENRILVKIDQELITSVDIYNQSKYLIALNEEMKNLKDEEIFEISKNFIIREKIKKISLYEENIELKIDDQILDRYIKSSFKFKKLNDLNDFKKFIETLELKFEYMREKLIIDILWNNLIFNKY